MIVLDTHAWLWFAGDPAKLSRRARARLARETEVAVSAMSCWEAGMLIERGRLRLSPDARLGIRDALAIPKLRVVPVSAAIATEAGLLGAGFHGDPADRIIVATALDLRAVLITKDERIAASGIVTTLW